MTMSFLAKYNNLATVTTLLVEVPSYLMHSVGTPLSPEEWYTKQLKIWYIEYRSVLSQMNKVTPMNYTFGTYCIHDEPPCVAK